MKKVVGIVPSIRLYENDDPYLDKYEFVNNYAKKVFESDAIAIGLLLDDGKLNYEQLSLCDAFIIPGGNKVNKVIYEILDYAYKNKKAVLGICLGMQAMAIYSTMLEECELNNVNYYNSDDNSKIYNMVKENNPILVKLDDDNIHAHYVVRNTIDSARHSISIKENTRLFDIYKSKNIDVVSLHGIVVKRMGKLFNVSATSSDGVIEAIESKDNDLLWIGVQYHPEIEDNNKIFKYFIDNIK